MTMQQAINNAVAGARMLVTSPTVASAPVPGSYNLLKMLAQEHFLNANCPHGFESLPNFFIKEK